MFDGGGNGMGGFGWGGFGGSAQRQVSKQDRDSELFIPIMQAMALWLVYAACVIATLVNAYLLHIDGWNLVGYVLPAIALLGIARGFHVSFRKRHWEFDGLYNEMGNWAYVAAAAFYVVWFAVWWVIGVPKITDWWVANLPEFMWNTPSILLRLIVIPSSYGLYKAAKLLGFRMSYEIVDPNWPPTIKPREPSDGPYNDEWLGRLLRDVTIPEDNRRFVQTKAGKNGTGSWKYYDPPEGVSYRTVWHLMCAINDNVDDEGTYRWIRPKDIGQKTYYKIQQDWRDKLFAEELPGNVVIMKEAGIPVMRDILEHPPGK